LTALLAGGGLLAFGVAARLLSRGANAERVAAWGACVGLPGFSAVIFAAPLEAAWLFRLGAFLIGFGAGLFSVGTLTAAMGLERKEHVGLALGAWGAVQASAAGLAVVAGGALRDGVGSLAASGALGEALASPATGYSVVYHLELLLLFLALIAIGPLVRPRQSASASGPHRKFGLAEMPG
jgi:BCD family chlorophyll transporter-like MFS transporter